MLQSDQANQVLRFVSRYAQEHNMTPYGLRSHEGLLRFLVIRQSFDNSKIMVNIVTAFKDEKIKHLARQLVQKFDFVDSVVNNINSRKAQVAIGEEEILLAGQGSIEDRIGSFRFNISANSFFQTNTRQAEILYKKVIEFAGLSENETVWDLYCGTGTISLFLAQKARRVYGFEITQSAVDNAVQNAASHHTDNISFIAGDVIDNMHKIHEIPDCLVTDPPRAGMHEKVVNSILEIAPEKIVYVSCNPTTMARDLQLLQKSYKIDVIQPLDMFPQTYHIECITRLTRI
jgi:23S rRNA (uracil1939-C5)-methyltransferase